MLRSGHSPVALSSADKLGCVLRGPGGLESRCGSQLLQGLPWWRGTSAIVLVSDETSHGHTAGGGPGKDCPLAFLRACPLTVRPQPSLGSWVTSAPDLADQAPLRSLPRVPLLWWVIGAQEGPIRVAVGLWLQWLGSTEPLVPGAGGCPPRGRPLGLAVPEGGGQEGDVALQAPGLCLQPWGLLSCSLTGPDPPEDLITATVSVGLPGAAAWPLTPHPASHP